MKIVVINLKRRPDRLAQFKEQAEKFGFEFELFEAIDGNDGNPSELNNGHWGCYSSHKAILERHETCMVLEDDAVLVEGFWRKLCDCLMELPADWGMLYLGGWKNETRDYSHHLLRADRVLCTHAYIVRNRFTHDLLETMESVDKIDLCFARTEGNKFISRTPLATQREGYSDIVGHVTNNTHLHE